jgi:EAL domain-containing protein (putative c-di-GMP-specific phosphodiesterase class I)
MAAPPRVLLVDGDPAGGSGIRAALDPDAADILVVHTGEDALVALAAQDVDVVVADDSAPDMRGTELLTRVRAQYPSVKRVLVSDATDPGAAARAVNDAEVFRLLVPPCRLEDLARSVSDAFAQRAQDLRYGVWLAHEAERAIMPVPTFRHALQTLWVAYQPIFRACDLGLYGFEALARVEHPRVPHPERLFGIAEALGYVHELDRAVRWRVAAWMFEAPPEATIFINVHPRSLMDERLLGGHEPLAAHADRVVLEITERSSLTSTPDLPARVARLRALGYRIALDDLGAGYAGLTTFAMLAPDIVKFDMELVRDIATEPTKAALVASMTTLCREIGVLSVAEGIETVAELESAQRFGCDLVQGFHLGRPRRDFDE